MRLSMLRPFVRGVREGFRRGWADDDELSRDTPEEEAYSRGEYAGVNFYNAFVGYPHLICVDTARYLHTCRVQFSNGRISVRLFLAKMWETPS